MYSKYQSCFNFKSVSAAFGLLRKRVFENSNIKSKTKLMVNHAVVIPTLLY